MTRVAVLLPVVAGPVVLPARERFGAPALGPSAPDAGRAVAASGGADFSRDARGPGPARERDLRWSGRRLTKSRPVCVYEAESGQRVHHAAHDGEVGIQWPGFGRPIEGRGRWTHR